MNLATVRRWAIQLQQVMQMTGTICSTYQQQTKLIHTLNDLLRFVSHYIVAASKQYLHEQSYQAAVSVTMWTNQIHHSTMQYYLRMRHYPFHDDGSIELWFSVQLFQTFTDDKTVLHND